MSLFFKKPLRTDDRFTRPSTLQKMFRKLSSKKKDKDAKKLVSGAAVPYNDSLASSDQSTQQQVRPRPRSDPPPHYNGVTPPELVRQMSTAAVKADIESLRRLFKMDNVDINARDENGNTALHKAAAAGRSQTIRYLLLHGADIDARNDKRETPLYVAMDYNRTTTVGVLLDYMHSVDNRPREPFVLLRAKKTGGNSYIPQKVKHCGDLKPFENRGAELIQLLIAHGQYSADISIFLYSVLDVPVEHTFFMNFQGELNMKNFQRFESKAVSQSVTVLNTFVKVMDVTGYEQLRCLILVSCDLVKLVLEDLPCLELLNVCYNKLDTLPQTISNCKRLKTLRCAHNYLRRIPSDVGELVDTLTVLDCSYNLLKRLPSKLVYCKHLKTLDCDHNGILELPIEIGMLVELEQLHVHNNKLSQIPLSVATLDNLKSISFHANPLMNIPPDFPERATDVKKYLNALQDDPVKNRTVKLVLVGQEGVGKTTLLHALKKRFWVVPRDPNTPKTDGIDVKDIKLKNMTLRCFDCGGDVDFNETHNFFITKGALYLVCFNLAEYCISTIERDSFLLGRLQLWLQYIFSKVPNAQVMIVGTHADHPLLSRKIFEEIWEQLRCLLVKAREHHRAYFRANDKLHDCLICQPDSKCLRRKTHGESTGFVNMGFEETASTEDDGPFSEAGSRAIAFPHVLGYYEVSSVKPVGRSNPMNINTNASVGYLKESIEELARRLTETNQELPRRWACVQESLCNYIDVNPHNSLASLNEVARIARGQGVTDREELVNMLQFLKAQGHILYFPQFDNLQDTVILDPEWLAKIFSSVISYRDTGFDDEGFISRLDLDAIWKEKHIGGDMVEKVLTLLRHFGVCLPVCDSTKELFPCKLPLGDPDESVWPAAPSHRERQTTYRITFPGIIPPPFFSNLLVTVYKGRAAVGPECKPAFYSNKVVDWLAVDSCGCKDCGHSRMSNDSSSNHPHRTLFELIPHTRTIQITVRGPCPCCLLPKVQGLVNKVADSFEGLGKIDIDTIVCPGCFMQGSSNIEKYSIKYLRQKREEKERVACSNAHITKSAKHLLCGMTNESCLPLATIRPKAARDKFDYSGCPKLFIMLPVNKDGLTFDKELKLYVSSLMFDGYAAHLLCEFPDGFHVTKAPGYRLKDPKEFMQMYGNHIVNVFRLLCHLSGSTVSPQYANQTNAVTRVIDNIIQDYERKFSICKCKSSKAVLTDPEDLYKEIQEGGQQVHRDDLRRCLHIMDRPDYFGPLRRLKYGENLLWLCNEHYRQMRTITLGSSGNLNVQAYVESSA